MSQHLKNLKYTIVPLQKEAKKFLKISPKEAPDAKMTIELPPWRNPQSLAKCRMRDRSRTKVARLKLSPPTKAPCIQAKSR